MPDAVRRECGGFLDDLVHELRAPLTAIAGYALLLQDDAGALPHDVARPVGRRPFVAPGAAGFTPGAGLGLVLAAAIAEAHGGALHYERADERTRFSLTLG